MSAWESFWALWSHFGQFWAFGAVSGFRAGSMIFVSRPVGLAIEVGDLISRWVHVPWRGPWWWDQVWACGLACFKL